MKQLNLMKSIKKLLKFSPRCLNFYYKTRKRLGLRAKNTEEVSARLSMDVRKTSRRVAGIFSFPFGKFHYVDIASLESQFNEIFVERGYDFHCERSNPFIIDCGGNIGLSVLRFKRQYPNSSIVVFEADPKICQILGLNIRNLALTSVDIIEAAVWDEDCKISFASDQSDAGFVNEKSGTGEVKATRLANYINQRVDLLKMDVEGAEYRVLEDLCRADKMKWVDRLVCEVHIRQSDDAALGKLLSSLSSAGFSFVFNHARIASDLPGEKIPTPYASVPDGKGLLHLYAWKPEVTNMQRESENL